MDFFKIAFMLIFLFSGSCLADGDQWLVYPTTINNRGTWISFNNSFSDTAKKDKNTHLTTFRLTFKNPNKFGFPTDQEFKKLLVVDDELGNLIEKTHKGKYVGRLTSGGTRLFFYYTRLSNAQIDDIKTQIHKNHGYKLVSGHKKDEEKQAYWDILYPKLADWQIISDMKVLDVLHEQGDKIDKPREVRHWAYFKSKQKSKDFIKWLKKKNYKLIKTEFSKDVNAIQVLYSHVGTMRLEDISQHSIASKRECTRLGGDYDGWETQIVK